MTEPFKLSSTQLHVIVQAGGRGSRLRHHTWNKPKCLVSVRGKPLLYHLFDRFPQAKFVIIGDYAFGQLEAYLEVNTPAVDFVLIRALEKGTASGIATALEFVPSDAPLILTWSDLIIGEIGELPISSLPIVVTTSSFTCRWSVSPLGRLVEHPSNTKGVAGLFYFERAGLLPAPPVRGEFVKWFSLNISDFESIDCSDLEELGDFAVLEASNDRSGFSRFFNKVVINESIVTKTVIDLDFAELHRREVNWYIEAERLGFRRMPKILDLTPFTMERIVGSHAYQMYDLGTRERRAVLANSLDTLGYLHDRGSLPMVLEDVLEVYLHKTRSRVLGVSAIIPGFKRDSVTVNGRKCRNFFSEKNASHLDFAVSQVLPKVFVPIHGDPTFSNSIVDQNLRIWLIDPRGSFAKPGIFGDASYDYAKLYYSAVGGYDSFNRRRFKLHIDDDTVEILMEESIFAGVAESVFADYFGNELAKIRIIHGLIWLSLSGYAKDDIDSVIGSFYLGLYWLEVGLSSV